VGDLPRILGRRILGRRILGRRVLERDIQGTQPSHDQRLPIHTEMRGSLKPHVRSIIPDGFRKGKQNRTNPK
jgi:hypothetical protein